MNPQLYGVDAIRRVEHYGRYVAKVAVPRRFVWEKPRDREIECPLIEWRIGERYFRAVISVEPDRNGWLDQTKAEKKLRELIAESRQQP